MSHFIECIADFEIEEVVISCPDLSEDMVRSLKKLKHLETLTISSCDNISSEFVRGLATLNKLNELTFVGTNDMGSNDMEIIGMGNNDMGNNDMKSDKNETNYSAICESLEYLNNIKSLIIEEGYFGKDFIPLIQAINKITYLERLTLIRLDISPEVLSQLNNKGIWELTFENRYWPVDITSFNNMQGLEVLNLISMCVDKSFTVDPEKLPKLHTLHWEIQRSSSRDK